MVWGVESLAHSARGGNAAWSVERGDRVGGTAVPGSTPECLERSKILEIDQDST